MPNLSDQFHNESILHQTDLMRLSEDVRQQALGFLNDLQADLKAQIGETDLFGTALSQKGQKAQKLIDQAQNTIDTAYQGMESSVTGNLNQFAKVEGKYAVQNLNDGVRGKAAGRLLTNNELEELVHDTWISGSPAKDWWAKQSKNTQDAFAQQIRIGYAQGETNDQLVGRILGDKTGRRIPIQDPKTGKTHWVDEYSKGVLNVSRREATALIRTAVQGISNNVLYWTYLENQDVLKGIQWLSTLDTRTTPLCRSRDGDAWDFEGKPLPQSKQQIVFPGPPPAHWQCRSTIIPITKSWNQLMHEAHGEKAAVSDTEAKQRLDKTPGTDEDKNQAASPLPVQKVDLGSGGTQQLKRLAKQTEETTVTPADLRLSDTKLDYSKVSDSIDSDNRSNIVAVRAEGKLIVVQGQEKVAAAALQNEAQLPIKVVDLPQKGRLLGQEIPAPAVPQPKHGLAPIVNESPLPVSTRASMDGQVASTTNYQTWLKDKPAAFQDEVLGPTKAKLFRAGKVTLSDLVDYRGNPLTLDDLAEKLTPDLTIKGLETEWLGLDRMELVRLAGSLGLTARETRTLLVSLGVQPPTSTSLYAQLDRGENKEALPTLTPEQSQTIQQWVEKIRTGKIKPL